MPAGLANSGYVYAANYNFVTIIDTTDSTSTVNVAYTDFPQCGIAVSPTGPSAGDVYVTSYTYPFVVSVIAPDGTVSTITLDNPSRFIAVAPAGVPDAGYVYVSTNSGISVIDPTGTLVYEAPLGAAKQLAVSPTGPKAGYVYAINGDGTVWEISPYANASLAIVNTITVGNYPRSLAISPTGTNAGNVYVGNYSDDTVSVIDPSDNVSTISVDGGFYPVSVAVSPVGASAGYVYLAGYNGDIDVIDPSGNIVGNIGGQFSYGVFALAVAPTGANAGNIYVGSYDNGTVTELAPDGTVINTFNVPSVAGIAIAP